MPVYKYRSLEEAEKHLAQLLPADPLVRLRQLEEFVAALLPPKPIVRGIFRFKTMEEANAHRKQVLGESF